jgi:hypothetical protein
MVDEIIGIRNKFNTSKSTAMFIDEKTGKALRYRTMQKWWNLACKDLQIYNKPIHRLRALGFSVLYESSGHDLALVRQVCGWQSEAWNHYSGQRRDKLPLYFNAIASMLGNNLICDTLNSPVSIKVGTLISENKEVLERVETIDKAFMGNLAKTRYNSDVDRIEQLLKHLGYKLEVIKVSVSDTQSAFDNQPQQ